MSVRDLPTTRCLVERDVPIAMRDGTILRADVYRPLGDGRHPVLLGRTQYGKSDWGRWIEPERTAAEAGYVVVVNDMRGQFASEGEFDPFRWDVDDSYDVVEWCAAQPWSNGRVGMYGSSSCGFVQLLAAVARPPHLVAIAPMQTWSSFGRGCIYEPGGGYSMHTLDWALLQVNLEPDRRLGTSDELPARRQATSRAAWEIERWYRHRPLSEFPPLSREEAPWYYDWVAHPDDDEWWADRDVRWRYDRITIPTLHLVGWFDRFSLSTIRNYEHVVAGARSEADRRRHRLIVGPWPHGLPVITRCGDRHYGPDAAVDVRALTLRWYDHWLKGIDTGLLDEPPVRLYVQGAEAWRDADAWPVPGAVETTFYLRGGGHAATAHGDGRLELEPPGVDEPADTYRYDPADPTPSVPGRLSRPTGPVDRRSIEERPDVLVYSTPPLDADVEVIGPIRARLWAATDGPDTDWTVCLVDVQPDGACYRVSDGMIRARYRETQRSATLLEPGREYDYEITLWPVATVFRRGHRIRVEVASASFPQVDANPNTGEPFGTATRGRPADQRVHHDRERPSHVLMPIIPTAGGDALQPAGGHGAGPA